MTQAEPKTKTITTNLTANNQNLAVLKTYDSFPLTQAYQDYVLQAGNSTADATSSANTDDYIAYYVGNESGNVSDNTGNQTTPKLYLMNQGFRTAHLTDLLQKLDTDSTFNPISIIAFGYHFDSKNLRELAENIKSFANKKTATSTLL